MASLYKLSLLLKFKVREFYSVERLNTLQNRKLRELVRHAYENVPYYHDLFERHNILPDDIKTKGDLKNIPILTKKDVRDHSQDLISRNDRSDVEKLLFSKTSGSTGIPLTIYFNEIETVFGSALNLYSHFKIGRRFTDKLLSLKIEASNKKTPLEKLKILRKYEIELTSPLSEIIENINEFKPDIIYCYPSFLILLGNFIKENDIKLWKPRIILTNGETLDQFSRRFIEEVFRSEVRDTYGSAEFWRVAYECEHGLIHIIPDSVIFEIDADTLEEDGSGEIIMTSLYQKTMPLIRYRIGDRAIISDKKCKCGSKFMTIEKITGRFDDYLVLPSGRRIPGIAIDLRNITEVKEIQIIQKKPEYIEVTVVPSKNFNKKDEVMLKELIKSACFKEKVEIKVIKIEKLSRTRTGKLRRVISEV
jgi:phenylacetate-CoA ligase